LARGRGRRKTGSQFIEKSRNPCYIIKDPPDRTPVLGNAWSREKTLGRGRRRRKYVWDPSEFEAGKIFCLNRP
jgi:hypothetical protein